MKIASPDILHKTDIGGVKLNLTSASEVRDAFDLIIYRAARHVASETARREGRRRHREQLAVETMSQSAPDAAWQQIEPLLDEAMANLNAADHDAVVLRYFESRSLREVGAALASSEDAAHYGIKMINRHAVLTDLASIVSPKTGHVVWLDTVLPMYSKKLWSLVGTIGIVRSTNHRFRLVCIFERT